MEKTLGIIKHDPWLAPYADAINGRHKDAVKKELELVGKKGNLVDFANAHKYFGLHKTKTGWVFREWAPNATEIYLMGTFTDWHEDEDYKLTRLDGGVWEINLPKKPSSMVTSTNLSSNGTVATEKESRHTLQGLFKMKILIFSLPRYGTRQENTNSK